MIDVQKLALDAGFRVFNGEIVAADGGVSGAASVCLSRFAALALEEAARKCDERAIDYAGLIEEEHASQRCAAIVRALKPTYTPSER